MESARPKPIILDCDPGHDDALAIMFAAGDPAVDLLAITTVAGNQTLDKTTLNARRVCSAAGITGVPIAEGCAKPLVAPLRVADDIHGASGLDGPSFGEPGVGIVAEHAVELTHRLLHERSDRVCLVPTGPLTNIALLLNRYPEDAKRIERIVLMGGSTERGNVTPCAEANIYVDPEAAAVVFGSGVPVTMCGLNVTHQALVTPEVSARFGALGAPLGELCVELMTFFAATYREVFGFPAPPLHDPVAVASVADPGLVRCVRAPVAVELTGEHTRGATVADLHGLSGEPGNVEVAVELDVPRFWDRLTQAVGNLAARRSTVE
ncbi:nucleoside hydrolase [Saccharomonospora sp. NPDC006951]